MATTIPSPLSSDITRRNKAQLARSPEPATEGKPRPTSQPDSHESFRPISSATTLIPEWNGAAAAADASSAMNIDTAFTSADDIVSRAYASEGDALIVMPTSAHEYRSLENLRDERNKKLRLFYLANHSLLIVTVPTAPHEQLHLRLNYHVLQAMGLRDDWDLVGATTYRSVIGSGSAGEADSGGRPTSTRPGNRQWPTLVVEAGWTQSLQSLRIKKDFWFNDSNHQVKIVVLAKAFPGNNNNNAGVDKRILLEHWQEPALRERPGATNTRLHAANRYSICLQTINIVWAGPVPYDDASGAMRQDHRNFNVTRDPLRLDFSALFLRQPTAGGNERDIVLDVSDLQRYAARVWLE